MCLCHFDLYVKNVVNEIEVALVRHKQKVPPPKKKWQKEAKIGNARVFSRESRQIFWIFHLHPRIFWVFHLPHPLNFFLKIQKNIYIFFWKVKSPPPKKFAQSPPRGVFGTFPKCTT